MLSILPTFFHSLETMNKQLSNNFYFLKTYATFKVIRQKQNRFPVGELFCLANSNEYGRGKMFKYCSVVAFFLPLFMPASQLKVKSRGRTNTCPYWRRTSGNFYIISFLNPAEIVNPVANFDASYWHSPKLLSVSLGLVVQFSQKKSRNICFL